MKLNEIKLRLFTSVKPQDINQNFDNKSICYGSLHSHWLNISNRNSILYYKTENFIPWKDIQCIKKQLKTIECQIKNNYLKKKHGNLFAC